LDAGHGWRRLCRRSLLQQEADDSSVLAGLAAGDASSMVSVVLADFFILLPVIHAHISILLPDIPVILTHVSVLHGGVLAGGGGDICILSSPAST